MRKIWISEVSALSSNDRSTIKFDKGLNIVYGPSNTGKTYIYNAIRYAMGGGSFPIMKSKGYREIEVKVYSDTELIILRRRMDENKILIESNLDTIPNGSYPIDGSTDEENISTILIKLLGIKGQPKVIKNQNYERDRLGLKLLYHLFLLDEQRIMGSSTPLIPVEAFMKTRAKSALVYLCDGIDRSDHDIQAAVKEISIRKAALTKYTATLYQEFQMSKEELSKQFDALGDTDLMEETIETLKEIEAIDEEIKTHLAEINRLMNEAAMHQNESNIAAMLIDQFEGLKDCYIADIERIEFFKEGVVNQQLHLPQNSCPLCDGEMTIEQAQNELEVNEQVLIEKKSLLKETLYEIKKQNEIQKIHHDELQKVSQSILDKKELISNQLRPKARDLKERYEKVLKGKDMLSRINHFDEMIELCEKVKNSELAPKDSKTKYLVDDLLPSTFEKDMTSILDEVLRTCNYINFETVEFSAKSMDVLINGNQRADNGKGHRGFINSCILLAIRVYLDQYGMYCPGLLVLDSPFTSLHEKADNPLLPDEMKNGFMNYLINNQRVGQTIIFENKIPKLSYEKHNVNIVKFTKGQVGLRYGFLNDVKD